MATNLNIPFRIVNKRCRAIAVLIDRKRRCFFASSFQRLLISIFRGIKVCVLLVLKRSHFALKLSPIQNEYSLGELRFPFEVNLIVFRYSNREFIERHSGVPSCYTGLPFLLANLIKVVWFVACEYLHRHRLLSRGDPCRDSSRARASG